MANLTANISSITTRFNTTVVMLPPGPNWTPYPIFLTVLVPLTIIAAGFLLVAFLTTRSLRTTFSVYIINLLLADFSLCAFVFSLDILSALYPSWFLGEFTCTVYLYLAYLLNGLTINAHALLAINRLWAVFFPLHYRQHQTRSFKIAVYICLVTFIYVNIMIAPGILLSALYTRLPFDKHPGPCRNNGPDQWAIAVQLLVYDLPWLFLITSMPLIWYKRSQRNPNRIGRTNGEVVPSIKVTEATRANKEQSFFKVWLVLTISTLILWAPVLLYYALDLALGKFPRVMYQVGRGLFSLTVLVDPILFMVMTPEIRTRIQGWLRRRNVVGVVP